MTPTRDEVLERIRTHLSEELGIDAAQIAFGQYIGGQCGVCFRNAEMHKNLSGEIAQVSIGVNCHRAIVVERTHFRTN